MARILTLTPYAGGIFWSSDIALENQFLIGGRVGIMANRWVGIEGYLSRISTDNKYQVTPELAGHDIIFNTLQYGGDLLVNLLPSGPIIPYALGGWQGVYFKPNPASLTNTSKAGPEVGGGLRIPVVPRVAIRVEGRDVMWNSKNPPPEPGLAMLVTPNLTHNQVYTLGVEFALGGSVILPDEDADGVPDKDDQCPHTPHGCQVDAKGCPIDSDGDGVCDGLDQCSNTPKGCQVDAKGCPLDSDGDGVCDGLDQCPNTPKGCQVDAKGCPIDSDGDGVCDGLDQCPDTPKGCLVDAKGCPLDSDGDGVCDGLDKCPNTPAGAKVDKDGCPIVVNEKEVELLDTGKITVHEIHFATGKSDVPPDADPILDEIGGILVQWPELRIEVGGYTDNVGSAKSNLDLSQRRAQAVMDYLLHKFQQIKPDQFTAKGYGLTNPVTSNATVEGKAQNRRVEFKVLNREVLEREKERRQILQK